MWNLTFGKNIECALEAILFSLGEEVEIEKLAEALEVHEDEIKEAVKVLGKRYEEENRGIKIIEIENAVQMCSNPEYYEGIKRVTQIKKQAGLSSAALETLSIIAYNQPITKSRIELIRGVDSTYSILKLTERGLIDEAGRLDAPGRPILYITTEEFLRCFGLSSLENLPEVETALPEE